MNDPHADPRDQTGIMDGCRLSEYVFHLVAYVNSKGLPEYTDAELQSVVQKASAWDGVQEHARRCRVCRTRGSDITAGAGPSSSSGVGGSSGPTHAMSTGVSLGMLYPECSHSSSERSGGGGWSGGGGGGGGGGGFDGGGGGFSGGGGDCGGSSSW